MARICVFFSLLVFVFAVFDLVTCRPSNKNNTSTAAIADITYEDITAVNNVIHIPKSYCGKTVDGTEVSCNRVSQMTNEQQRAVLDHYMPLFSTLLKINVLQNIEHKLKVDASNNNPDCEKPEQAKVNREFWNELLALLRSIWPGGEPMTVVNTEKQNSVAKINMDNFESKLTNFLKDLLETKKITDQPHTQILTNDESIGKSPVISESQLIQPVIDKIYDENIQAVNQSDQVLENENKNSRNIGHMEVIPDDKGSAKSRDILGLLAVFGKRDTIDSTRRPVLKLGFLQDMSDLTPPKSMNKQKIRSDKANNSSQHRNIQNPLKSYTIKNPNISKNELSENIGRGYEKSPRKELSDQISEAYDESPENPSLQINYEVDPHPTAMNNKMLLSSGLEEHVQSAAEKQPLISNHHTLTENSEASSKHITDDNETESGDDSQDLMPSHDRPNETSSSGDRIIKKHNLTGKAEVHRRENDCLEFLALLLRRMAQEETARSRRTSQRLT